MKNIFLALFVTLFALTGCKKKSEQVKPVSESTEDRISGTHSAVDIIWEEEDLK